MFEKEPPSHPRITNPFRSTAKMSPKRTPGSAKIAAHVVEAKILKRGDKDLVGAIAAHPHIRVTPKAICPFQKTKILPKTGRPVNR